MPCTYYSPSEERDIASAALNDATRLLCQACGILESNKIALPTELAAWWKDHQERDKARIKAENALLAKQKEEAKVKKQALSKLTEAEKKALGIK